MGGKGYHFLTYVAAELIVHYIEIIILNLILLLLTCVCKSFLATEIGPEGTNLSISINLIKICTLSIFELQICFLHQNGIESDLKLGPIQSDL